MKQEYQDWIKANAKDPIGRCKELTDAMKTSFPELRQVRGHYDCMVWGRRGHWWLLDEQGGIVDPSAEQFPTRGAGEYIEWQEGTKEPSGKCVVCGGYCWDGNYFCSEKCELGWNVEIRR